MTDDIDKAIKRLRLTALSHGQEMTRETFRSVWTDKDTVAAKAKADEAEAHLRALLENVK